MPLPSDWSTSNGLAQNLAERLIAWRPDLRRRIKVDRDIGSDPLSLVIQVPSPTEDAAREIHIRIRDNGVQILFGPSLVVLRESLNEDRVEICIRTLEGILTDRILLYKRSGFRTHSWEVIDTQGKEFDEAVSRKYQWGRYEIKSWSGESDGSIRLFGA